MLSRILVLTKRQYTNKDLLDDRFGRIREIPLELALRDFHVFGLCLSYKKKSEGRISDGVVEWESLNAGFLKLLGLIRFFRRASQLAKESDVIWACSDSVYGIIGYILARKHGKMMIFDLYDNFEYFLAVQVPIIRLFYRRVIRRCHAVTCVSQPLADLIRSYRNNPGIYILENGVRKDIFRPLPKSHCRQILNLPIQGQLIGTAGALASNRGIQTLFKAFQHLQKGAPDLHLVLAGKQMVPIPNDSHIHYLGLIPLHQVAILFNALDVAVVCNRQNEFGKYCFPQKAREIMACDIPIVASRVGSMKALLSEHPEWLFEPDDSNDLANVLNKRLKDRRTGYAEVLSWDAIAESFHSILCDTILKKKNDCLS